MTFSTRISRTLAAAALAVTASVAIAPGVASALQGPGDITHPVPCTHGCGGFDPTGPGDLTAPTPPPVVDPGDPGAASADVPIVVAQPTFTG